MKAHHLLLEQMPKEISEMVAVPRGLWQGASAGQSPRKGWDPFFPPRLGLPTQHSQRPLATPALSQAILSELLGRRPGRNGLSAVSSAQGQGLSDIGLCLFLADRPFRLGHLEISFGICSRLSHSAFIPPSGRNTAWHLIARVVVLVTVKLACPLPEESVEIRGEAEVIAKVRSDMFV